ncbi:hypothetical protein Hdeb2414_s0003g00103311 [Helianthus debilis subsp. tardiflorus]
MAAKHLHETLYLSLFHLIRMFFTFIGRALRSTKSIGQKLSTCSRLDASPATVCNAPRFHNFF